MCQRAHVVSDWVRAYTLQLQPSDICISWFKHTDKIINPWTEEWKKLTASHCSCLGVFKVFHILNTSSDHGSREAMAAGSKGSRGSWGSTSRDAPGGAGPKGPKGRSDATRRPREGKPPGESSWGKIQKRFELRPEFHSFFLNGVINLDCNLECLGLNF